MIMGKLNRYCANIQKTGDPEWKLMLSALESMVDSLLRLSVIEQVNLVHSIFSPVHRDGITPSVSQFLANIHVSS